MNKFIKHIFLKGFYFVCLIISLILLTAFIRCNNPFIYNEYQNKFLSIKDINIGIYGHSQSRGGIDSKTLTHKSNKIAINFSEGGTPLFYNIKRIRNHLKFNKDLKIILEIGSNDLDARGILGNFIWDLDETSSYPEIIGKNYQYFNLDELKLLFNRKWYKTIVYIIYGQFRLHNYIEGVGINKPNLNLTDENVSKFKKYLNARKGDNHMVDYQIKMLVDLIQEYPKNNFLIIRIPEHPINIKEYNNSSKLKAIAKKLAVFNNVSFKDYGLLELDHQDYLDFNHLSYQGMIKFTKKLKSDFSFFFNE